MITQLMYAIIEVGGLQWRVELGTRLDINRVEESAGSKLTVKRVLFTHDGERAQIGRPYVPGAKVVCEVLEHLSAPKVVTFRYRPREHWRKKRGHRQPLTRVIVKDIQVGA